MHDPPGAQSSLGIEDVEWFSEGGPNLTVRVTGRWRRRRSEWRGPVLLVVEVQGKRHRFPAMPEPPSLTGALRGTWRMTFSVPAELAPYLGGRTWLQLGAASVPLPEKLHAGADDEPGPPDVPAEPAPREVPAEPAPVEVPAKPAPVEVPAETAPPPAPLDTEPPAPASPAVAPPAADTTTYTERQARENEFALEAVRRRAREAEAASAELARRVGELEAELREFRREPQRLRELLAQRERERRAAEQRAHAERARRLEAEEELAAQAHLREDEGALGELEARVRELENDLEEAQRAAAEAEHLAAAAEAARHRAERRAQELEAREPPPAEAPEALPASTNAAAAVLAAEAGLLSQTRAATAPPAGFTALPPPDKLGLGLEAEARARAATERRAVALESELVQQRERVERVYGELEVLREELGLLRAEIAEELFPPDAAAEEPAPAEAPPPAEASEPPAATAPAPPPQAGHAERSGPIEAQKLAAALERLRESTPPLASPGEAPTPASTPAAAASTTAKPWLERVFRALLADDPAVAGRLLLALLPAQREVHPLPVAYDLILSGQTTVRVTAGAGATSVEFVSGPRPREEVHFQVRGDLAALARLMLAGRLRRRLSRSVARVQGDRAGVQALRALLRPGETLVELHTAGVRPDPGLALTIVALMIEPEWTVGESFTIAHQGVAAGAPTSYLEVRPGHRPTVGMGAPEVEAETTLVCAAEELLPALAGRRAPNVFVRGDRRPLGALAAWLDRAQSG